MSRKVGILTFHRAINYGAVLQTYALQQAIARISPDIDVKVIDYRCPAIESTREPKMASSRRGFLSSTMLNCLHHPFRVKRQQKFDTFVQRSLSLTQAYSRDELGALNDDFNCLVSGSDQVWNPRITHGDSSFFLDFADGPQRVSYAASFGSVALPEISQPWARRLLRHLDVVSVREKSAADIVESLNGKRPSVTIDPTLLLTREDWSTISKLPRNLTGERYILIYNMVSTDHLIGFARKLARATGCKLRLIGMGFRHNDISHVRTVGPDEFIGLFQNAEFVVCNSFHGVAFSINFERPFFTETIDATGKINARVQNLLEITGLENRALQQGHFSGDLSDKNNIDWQEVRICLDAARQASIDFLRSTIGVC